MAVFSPTKAAPTPAPQGAGFRASPFPVFDPTLGAGPKAPAAPRQQIPYKQGASPAQIRAAARAQVRSEQRNPNVNPIDTAVASTTEAQAQQHAQVMATQRQLVAAGYHLAVDGVLGPQTQALIADYHGDRSLLRAIKARAAQPQIDGPPAPPPLPHTTPVTPQPPAVIPPAPQQHIFTPGFRGGATPLPLPIKPPDYQTFGPGLDTASQMNPADIAAAHQAGVQRGIAGELFRSAAESLVPTKTLEKIAAGHAPSAADVASDIGVAVGDLAGTEVGAEALRTAVYAAKLAKAAHEGGDALAAVRAAREASQALHAAATKLGGHLTRDETGAVRVGNEAPNLAVPGPDEAAAHAVALRQDPLILRIAKAQGRKLADESGSVSLPDNTPPPLHSIKAGELEVHPVRSNSRAVAAIQERLNKRTEARISEGKTSLLDHVPGQSAEAKVGRLLAAQRTVEDRLANAPLHQLEHLAPSRGVSALLRSGKIDKKGILGRNLLSSAGEQKALDVLASGVSHETHVAYHENALALAKAGHPEYGEAQAHEIQLALLKAAESHVQNPSENLTELHRLSRNLIKQREEIHGFTADAAAHRVGARALELESLAAGKTSPLIVRRDLMKELDKATEAVFTKDDHATLRNVEDALTEYEKGRPQDAFYRSLQREHSDLLTKRDNAEHYNELVDAIKGIDAQIVERGHQAEADGGFYTPTKTLLPTHGSNMSASPSPSEFGIGPPGKNDPSLRHTYTGALERTGNYRTDVSGLVGESYRLAQRWASLERGYRQALRLSHATEEEAGGVGKAIPIRTNATIPDALREYIKAADHGTLSDADYKAMQEHGHDLESLRDAFFPKLHDNKNIRWVNEDYLRGLNKRVTPRTPIGKGIDTANQALTTSLIYTSPKYAINFLQNLGTAAIQQGVMLPANFKRGLSLAHAIGPDDYARVISLMDAGRAHALTGREGYSQILNEATAHLGNFWQRVTDGPFRVSSFLHEAGKRGYRTPEQIKTLLNDPAHRAELVHVVERGNREAIDFAEMTPQERMTVKRAFIFYPWLRASALWTARFPLEHPLQAAAFSAAGYLGHQKAEHAWHSSGIAHIPDYLANRVPLMHGHLAVNLGLLENWDTVRSAIRDAIHGKFSQNLSPGAGILNALISGKDSFGNTPHGMAADHFSNKHFGGAVEQALGMLAPYDIATTYEKGAHGTFPGGVKGAIEQGLGGSFVRTVDPVAAEKAGEKQLPTGQATREHFLADIKAAGLPAPPPQVMAGFDRRAAITHIEATSKGDTKKAMAGVVDYYVKQTGDHSFDKYVKLVTARGTTADAHQIIDAVRGALVDPSVNEYESAIHQWKAAQP